MAGTGLRVEFVESLDDVVDPVITHLRDVEGRDLFERDVIVVPNAGVRAWLLQRIAHRLGATEGRTDGIAANLTVGYLGLLQSLVRGVAREDDDPWSIDAMTMAILRCLSRPTSTYGSLVRRHDGRVLRAARVMADRFDSYHARRPGMIEQWEAGRAVLAPEVGTHLGGSEWSVETRDLAESDAWQFRLWHEVRNLVGVPSPPVQVREALERVERGEVAGLPSRILVVGLQSLPAHHIRVVRALGSVVDITALLIHPSPSLARRWAIDARRFAGVDTAMSADVVETGPVVADDLAATWLRGSRDMQVLLAAGGIEPVHPGESRRHGDDLLARVKRIVASAGDPSGELEPLSAPEADHSVAIHRGHTLARQAEILHDALLHAFTDLPGLEPHEVVILCADMSAAAPHLEAVFDRDVTVRGSDGTTRTVRIPLVIADRGLREVSESALVLDSLLGVLTGRMSRGDLLGLFGQPPVLRAEGHGSDVVEFWGRLLENSGMRWGLDDGHRAVRGLVGESGEPVDLADAYSWLGSVRQALLGALVPDAVPAHELNGTTALTDLDTADIAAVASLVRLVGIIREAERATRDARSIPEWCDLVESTVVALCGTGADDLESVAHEVDRLRRATSVGGAVVDDPVPFEEFAAVVDELVTAIPGRQPLRTGAVTATSMVPLRSVPFRVVCVLGFDDTAVGVSDFEGDDLRGRQRLVGDSDSRLETRRTFLDAALAAQDRFIVTCIGRSVRNNTPVPFVTPLAEFVDFCVHASGSRGRTGGQDAWTFVHDHPRHAFNPSNFAPGAIVRGAIRPWSHDEGARGASRQVASSTGSRAVEGHVRGLEVPPATRFDFEDLVKVFSYPEDFYFETIDVSKWDDRIAYRAEDATIPMSADARLERALVREWAGLVDSGLAPTPDAWIGALHRRGAIPVGAVGTFLAQGVVDLVSTGHALLAEAGFASVVPTPAELTVDLGDARVVELDSARPANGVTFAWIDHLDVHGARRKAAIELFMRRAKGVGPDFAIIIGLPTSKESLKAYRVWLSDDMDASEATARLRFLADAVDHARRAPALKFGDTGPRYDASVPGAVREKFDDFVTSDRYLTSTEALFFGEEPRFDDVFGDGLPVAGFWTARRSAITEEKWRSGKVKLPHVDASLQGYEIR